MAVSENENGWQPSGPPDAIFGYTADMSLYKNNDFRCLKPKESLPSEEWPHYDMDGFRSATSQRELDEVKELKFYKAFFNFEDPTILKLFTSGKNNGLVAWKTHYGFDWADWTHGEGYEADLSALKEHCIKAEFEEFGRKCLKDGGIFKCFAWQ